MKDWRSSYSRQALANVKAIGYGSKIYVTEILHRCVKYWNHLYLNHPGGGIISNTILQ